MTLYFMGGEMGAFTPSDSTSFEVAESGSFARGVIKAGSGAPTQYAESAAFTAPDEFWTHINLAGAPTTGTYTSTALEIHNGTKGVFRIRDLLDNSGSAYQMQYWDGAAWQDAGSPVSHGGGRQDIDLYIDGNTASGTATLYLSGTERESASVDLSQVTGVVAVRSYGINTATGNNFQQAIISDVPLIGWRLGTFYASGSGATGDWTGTYTNIDETVYSDADFIYSDTADQVELFTGTSIADLTQDYVVQAVGVYARAKRGASGPANLQLALRVNGTTYVSSSKALGLGYDSIGAIWEQNPDTTSDWLNTELSTLQFGVKSIT